MYLGLAAALAAWYNKLYSGLRHAGRHKVKTHGDGSRNEKRIKEVLIMPTTYTHFAYGQEMLQLLPERIEKVLRPCEDYYNIGVHGPDILFYYRAFSKNKVNQYGVKVHREPMKTFLEHAFKVYEKQKQKEEAFAYLAGFMTHFILDSSCHPYIRRRIAETGISHTEIERDWDVLMMRKDHLDPMVYKAACHIRTTKKYGTVIAPYYRKKPMEIQKSLCYMRLILDHIFRSAFGVTGHAAAFVNRKFMKKLKFEHYFVKRKVNPANKETCKELFKLYAESQELCAGMITELYDALQAGDLSFCEKKRFQRHFS